MNNPVGKILYQKAALIFEELGFLMPQSDTCDNFQTDSPGAWVSFNGPFKGCLLLSLNRETISCLCSNMLGQEEPAGKQMGEDAIRELSNVICGNALPAIYGLKEEFNLAVPELYEHMRSVTELSDYSCVAKIAIPFDCGQASIFLYTENAAVDHPLAFQ